MINTTTEITIKPNMFNMFNGKKIRVLHRDTIRITHKNFDKSGNKYYLSAVGIIKGILPECLLIHDLQCQARHTIRYDDILDCDIDAFGYASDVIYAVRNIPILNNDTNTFISERQKIKYQPFWIQESYTDTFIHNRGTPDIFPILNIDNVDGRLVDIIWENEKAIGVVSAYDDSLIALRKFANPVVCISNDGFSIKEGETYDSRKINICDYTEWDY